MSVSRRNYSREFKIEAVRRVHEMGLTQAEVAGELGVSVNSVNRWVKQFRQNKAEAFPGKGHQTSQAALISRLRRENERLR